MNFKYSLGNKLKNYTYHNIKLLNIYKNSNMTKLQLLSKFIYHNVKCTIKQYIKVMYFIDYNKENNRVKSYKKIIKYSVIMTI